MLLYDKHIPAGAEDGTPVLILLHGRGSDKNDLMGLQPGLPPEFAMLTPRGPFSGSEWGYGGGFAWYRYLGGTTPEPAPFEHSMAELEQFLSALPEILAFTPGPIVIGGFSQGGTTATAFALSHPAAVSGVLLFSGFIASHPSIAVTPESTNELRMFWGHGTYDQMIPFQFAADGRAQLNAISADLEARDYPIEHQISPKELADASQWLRSFVPAGIGAVR